MVRKNQVTYWYKMLIKQLTIKFLNKNTKKKQFYNIKVKKTRKKNQINTKFEFIIWLKIIKKQFTIV